MKKGLKPLFWYLENSICAKRSKKFVFDTWPWITSLIRFQKQRPTTCRVDLHSFAAGFQRSDISHFTKHIKMIEVVKIITLEGTIGDKDFHETALYSITVVLLKTLCWPQCNVCISGSSVDHKPQSFMSKLEGCRNLLSSKASFNRTEEIFLIWNYEVFQETIEEVLISKMFLIILRAIKATFGYSMFHTTLNWQATHTETLITSDQNNVTMDDPVSPQGRRKEYQKKRMNIKLTTIIHVSVDRMWLSIQQTPTGVKIAVL